MSRLNDRPNGRRPRAPKFPSARPEPATSRPKLPLAVKKSIAWCDRVRFDAGRGGCPAHDWGDWADEVISLPGAEGVDR